MNKMKFWHLISVILLISSSCYSQSENTSSIDERLTIEALIQNLEDSENDQIIAVAH